jgi:CCR4-NOT transcription complex subunit 6
VANTHIYWDPEFADVKLWQTWVLCQELENLVLNRNLALLLCGDFNSMTDSSVYQLLSGERIQSTCPAIQQDILGVLPPLNTLAHRLPIHSAFATIGEPKFTNFTGHFVGTLDYVFYSKSHLVATSCLDVDSEEMVSKHTALPSPLYSSDHVCLVTEMDWLLDV